jgi:hypothetical protein
MWYLLDTRADVTIGFLPLPKVKRLWNASLISRVVRASSILRSSAFWRRGRVQPLLNVEC